MKNAIDRFVLAKLEANGMTAERAGGQAHADPPRLLRPDRPAADAGGGERVPRRQLAERLREGRGPPARVAALRRALGPALARHRALLRHARASSTGGARRLRSIPTPGPTATTSSRRSTTTCRTTSSSANKSPPTGSTTAECQKNPATLAALGFLTLGDRFNGNVNDIINDRIDVTSKAFLGLTVTCARCHDHKFDPIPTADYYSLYGIFASSMEPARSRSSRRRTPRTREYLVKRREMDERIKTHARAEHQRVCSATTGGMAPSTCWRRRCPRTSGRAYLHEERRRPGAAAELDRSSRAPRFRPGVPIFEVWSALARMPAAQVRAAGAARSDLLRGNRRSDEDEDAGQGEPSLSPAGAARPSAASSATTSRTWPTIYGKLLARTDAGMGGGDSAGHGKPRCSASCRGRRRTSSCSCASRATCSSSSDPGAPARAHVLVDSPKPADSPIFVRGQAETPGQVVPRRFLEVLSGNEPAALPRRQRTARTRQRHREQDQPADRARDGQPRLAASFRRRLRQHAGRSRQPVGAADASGIARLACEPVHGRRLVA